MARHVPAAAALVAGAAAGYLIEKQLLGWVLGADLPETPSPGTGTARPRTVRQRTVRTSDGIDLYVEIEEPDRPDPDSSTVVFVHGFSMTAAAWDSVRQRLSPDLRLVSYDQRSHGRSGRGGSSSHSIDQLGEDLERVLEQVVPDGPVVLAGHSMGGMTILALAARRPDLFGDRIRAVGLISTSAGGIPEVTLGFNPRVARLLHGSTKGLPRLAALSPAVVDRWRNRTSDLELLMIRLLAFGGRVPVRECEFVAEMVSEISIQAVAQFLPALEEHDKRDAVPVLAQVPALVLVGDSDLLTPVSHSEAMAAALPGAELVVLPGAGHMTLTERPDAVSEGIEGLIAQVRDGSIDRGPVS